MSQDLLAFAAWAAANPQLINDEDVVARSYRDLFASPAGRVVLAHLVTRYKILSPSFYPGATYADTAFFDGQKQVVAEIVSDALVGDALANFLQSTSGAPNDRPNRPILD
jgi:hypothetical protein